MLTEDGKHLYVGHEDYHRLIEQLALMVRTTQAGSLTPSCVWPVAACAPAIF